MCEGVNDDGTVDVLTKYKLSTSKAEELAGVEGKPSEDQIVELIEYVKSQAVEYFDGKAYPREISYEGIDDENGILYFTAGVTGDRIGLERITDENSLFYVNWKEFDEANKAEASDKGIVLPNT